MEAEAPEQLPKTPKRKRRIVALVLVLGVVGVGLWFVLRPAPKQADTESQTEVAPAADVPIKIDLYQEQITVTTRISPVTVKIKRGDSVAWISKDRTGHLIVSDSGPVSFRGQGKLGLNDMYLVTFTTAGTYTYHDEPNPSAKGTIIVE